MGGGRIGGRGDGTRMVSLVDGEGRGFPVPVGVGVVDVRGLGVVDTDRFVGVGPGEVVRVNEREFFVAEPGLVDLLGVVRRGPQVVGLKDALVLVGRLGISAGKTVVEGGSGSGSLSIVLGYFVSPIGRVFSYDNREEHLRVARKNVESAGLGGVVYFKVGDIYKGVDERDVDAFVLDVPEPWRALESAWRALKPGGWLGCFVPTYNQAERVMREAMEMGFLAVRCTETLEREMVLVGKGDCRGMRPSFDMLGHTGFVVTMRRGAGRGGGG